MIRRAVTLVAATLLLVACGDGDGDGRFDAAVDEVRAAVQAGDRDAAFAHLDAVGILAMEAHAEGELGEDEVAELGALLDQARLLVSAEVPAPATTEAPPPEPPTTEPAPAPVDDDDDDDDEKRGRKGDKKDKDDD